MKPLPRIASVSPVMFGVLKLTWTDNYEGVVDLRPLLANGDVFEFLRASPERFMDVRLGEHGHRIYWIDDEGDEIDLGAESLRRDAERQAEVHRLMAV